MTLTERIDELVVQHGSLRAVARVTEIDTGYLSRLRAGEKTNPDDAKLRRLGLRRVVTFERLNGGQPVSSLKDTPPLTPELESAVRGGINPAYVTTYGTGSYERAALLGEIDRLRAEVAELAQQRGDMLRHVIALRVTLAGAREHIQAARDELYECHAGPDGAVDALGQEGLDEDDEMLRRIDLALSINVASESQPSEQTR